MIEMKLKILMVVLSSVSPDVRVEKEARFLANKGHDVTIIAIDRIGNLPKEEKRDGYLILRVQSRKRLFSKYFEFWKNTQKVVGNSHYDVLHLHDLNVLPLASRLKDNCDVIIYDSHENFPEQMSETFGFPALWLYNWLEKKYLKKVHGVITAGITYSENLRRKYNVDSTWITNYPSREDVEKAHSIVLPVISKEKKKFKVVSFGVMYKNLGYDKTVEVAEIMSAKLSPHEIEFCIIGSGPAFESTNKLVKDKNLDNYFNLTGWMDYIDALSFLRTFDVGLVLFQPGKNNFLRIPNRLYDYCSAGIAFIGSNFEGLRRAVVNTKKFGLLIDPTSPSEIAEAVFSLYNDNDKLSEMKRNANYLYKNEYNWEKEANKIFEKYSEALEKVRGNNNPK